MEEKVQKQTLCFHFEAIGVEHRGFLTGTTSSMIVI
jgi:hypothetical protein